MTKILLNHANIYTFIWCLYYLQGTLYPEGGGISQGLLFLFLLISIFYLMKVWITPDLPKVITALKYLAVLFGIYGMLRINADTMGWEFVNSETTYFKEYELSILPVFAFYHFARNRIINFHWFYKAFFFFCIVAVFQFSYQETIALSNAWREETTNNAGYFVVSLLPLLVFLKKKPLFQYGALFIIFILVIQSMKRGAIVAVALGSAYFLWDTFLKARGKIKLVYTFLGIVVAALAIMYFQNKLEESSYMQLRYEMTKEGDMSERENMYPKYLEFYKENAGVQEIIFGYGANSTLRFMGDFAHQDWIETLMNNGVVGIVLLMFFWISLIATYFKSRVLYCTNLSLIIALFIIIYFIKSMVSMSINSMTLFATSALAYALAGLDDYEIREELSL